MQRLSRRRFLLASAGTAAAIAGAAVARRWTNAGQPSSVPTGSQIVDAVMNNFAAVGGVSADLACEDYLRGESYSGGRLFSEGVSNFRLERKPLGDLICADDRGYVHRQPDGSPAYGRWDDVDLTSRRYIGQWFGVFDPRLAVEALSPEDSTVVEVFDDDGNRFWEVSDRLCRLWVDASNIALLRAFDIGWSSKPASLSYWDQGNDSLSPLCFASDWDGYRRVGGGWMFTSCTCESYAEGKVLHGSSRYSLTNVASSPFPDCSKDLRFLDDLALKIRTTA